MNNNDKSSTVAAFKLVIRWEQSFAALLTLSVLREDAGRDAADVFFTDAVVANLRDETVIEFFLLPSS